MHKQNRSPFLKNSFPFFSFFFLSSSVFPLLSSHGTRSTVKLEQNHYYRHLHVKPTMNTSTMTTTTTTKTLQQATVPLKGSVATPPAQAPSASATASAVGGGSGTSSNVGGGNGGGGGVSGFVLKLFSMINGAEDEVVSVSCFYALSLSGSVLLFDSKLVGG
mmetsp:Transcript_5042/g.12773  ORF Transcript_5042/g.12773 Transcript_5042/m.12773 type:complete len:162 (+) Transcript_5042:466-951(+)